MKTMIFLAVLLLAVPAFSQKADGDTTTFRAEEVSFRNTTDSITLHGTLTLPDAPRRRFPAVLLLTGSGPQDRDETILGHKPFRAIAQYLSARGFAVLRFDDRGGGKMNAVFAKATLENFVKDAAAGLAYLRTRPEIDPRRVGLLGHSEGGSVAPALAAGNPGVAFVVLLAAPGVSHFELMVQQNRDIFRGMRYDSAVVEQYLDGFYKPALTALRQSSDTAQLARQFRGYLADLRQHLSKEQLFRFGIPPKEDFFVKNFITSANGTWFRHFIAYDPAPALQRLTCPVLALNGTKDVQVAAEPNLQGIEQNLKKAGNRRYQLVRLPGLNHLFLPAKTGLTQEYATQKGDFDAAALRTIGAWLAREVGRSE